MSILEYVRDYFFSVMKIEKEDQIPRLFLKAVEERDLNQLAIWFDKLEEYVKENNKDEKNLYFNRMRFYINQEFGTVFNYAHL